MLYVTSPLLRILCMESRMPFRVVPASVASRENDIFISINIWLGTVEGVGPSLTTITQKSYTVLEKIINFVFANQKTNDL